MNIALIIPVLDLGGAETMCENLAYSLDKLGHKVIVISLYSKQTPIASRLIEKGIQVKFLKKKQGLDLSLFFRLAALLKKERVNVIHTHIYAIKYGVFAAMLSGVKIRIHTVHNVAEKEAGKAARLLNNYFFKRCGVIPVALSELIRESIVKEYGIKMEKIPVVFNGIDLSNCIPKTEYGNDSEFIILNIARFSQQKNHKGLIEVFEKFNKTHPNSRLWLIGEGSLKDSIRKQVKEAQLENKVEFLGVQSNVYQFLNKADIFVLPSKYEGVPMTIIEAMGTGLPIIASDVGGIPDMLENNFSAILTAVDSTETEIALEHIYYDQILRERLGKNARIQSNRFSSTVMGKKYLEIYQGTSKIC